MKILKISFIGPECVGKTSIIMRYTRNTFTNSYLPTLGIDLYNVGYNSELQFVIWDIASQKQFDILRPSYLANSSVCIICVDYDRFSYDLIKHWIDIAKKYSNINTELLIAINKIDLIDQQHNKLHDHISSIQSLKIPVIATSAKSGENISNLFDTIVKNQGSFLEKPQIQ